MTLKIRDASPDDCSVISGLLRQLGYEIDSHELKSKIADQGKFDKACVAERNGKVIACISLHVIPLFHVKGNMGRITSLVVDELHRREKIGKALLDIAETWFREKDCLKIEVTSGNERLDAHRFYEKNAYSPDGKRFSKKI